MNYMFQNEKHFVYQQYHKTGSNAMHEAAERNSKINDSFLFWLHTYRMQVAK